MYVFRFCSFLCRLFGVVWFLSFLVGFGFAKTLIYCPSSSPEGFDPAIYAGADTFQATRVIYDRLVTFGDNIDEVHPLLAESWEVSPDGLSYTFHLKRGIKFQTTPYFKPTRALNADDVIFSFERQWKTDNPWYHYLKGASWQVFDTMGFGELLKSIVKIDDYTVRFTLTRTEAPFLGDLAMDFASILSKEYADQLTAQGRMVNLNSLPIGTGSFSLVTYQKNAMVRYNANPDYFLGKAALDILVFSIVTDPMTRLEKLRAGECQIVAGLNPSQIPALKADKNFVVETLPGLNLGYMAYNTEQAPFDKVEVRQALNMAINKQAILDYVYLGMGRSAKTSLPEAMWGVNKDIPDTLYNPQAAKALLEKAGVKDLKTTIWAMSVSRAYMPNARRAAELIQADWAQVGVRAEIRSMDWETYQILGAQKGRDGAIFLGWATSNGDPDDFMGNLWSCAGIDTNNYARWCYPPYETLIRTARTTLDKNKRVALYEEAQKVFYDQAPALLIAHARIPVVFSKRVKNYAHDALGFHKFGQMDIGKGV
ncbi:ABC transporter substrate-binding protein [Bartonella sp. DGB2]|uniref:ABC transporter substrate-binding protein n=1 Tax=Bartonella sp. DGB2 TaxID=3388426 RepID=UPI00398FC235